MPTDSTLTRNQKQSRTKVYVKDGTTYKIIVSVRFDDECGNGHNTFSITADQYRKARNGRWVEDSFGCQHDLVAEHFPELQPFIKWHLCSTDGPMHYPANPVFFASDRDCWGGRKGDPRSVDYFVKGSGGGLLVEWPEEKDRILGPKPQKFRTREEAQSVADACGGSVVEWVTMVHEGKERELDSARRSAIWPEATDEELTAPDLKDRLIARLPALMAEFRKDMESLGFTW